MTYIFLHPIMHLLLFLSPDWLTFCHVIISYKFTRFFIYFLFLSDEGPMLETLDYTIRISSTPTILYFDLYLYSAYAVHYVYINYIYIKCISCIPIGYATRYLFVNRYPVTTSIPRQLRLHFPQKNKQCLFLVFRTISNK